MDATTAAITIDLFGWTLWLLLTHLIARDGPANNWVTVDYYLGTILLLLSTLCTAAGAFLADETLVARIAVPGLLLGVGILTARRLRSLRAEAHSARASYTSDAPAARPQPRPARPPRPQWRTMTAAPARPAAQGQAQAQGGLYTDPLIQDIEARRMTA